MAHGSHETEIKLAVANAQSARRLLRANGFRVVRPRVFEANTVFDTQTLTLRKSSTLLRVREAGGTVRVTFKGKSIPGRHKSREELELAVSHAGAMTAIFDRLGYRPSWRYEKYRTEFHQPGRAGVIMLDETPIGAYLELEGTPHWIDRTARHLGFQESDYITASYGRLYLDWCARRRRKPSNMVF